MDCGTLEKGDQGLWTAKTTLGKLASLGRGNVFLPFLPTDSLEDSKTESGGAAEALWRTREASCLISVFGLIYS